MARGAGSPEIAARGDREWRKRSAPERRAARKRADIARERALWRALHGTRAPRTWQRCNIGHLDALSLEVDKRETISRPALRAKVGSLSIPSARVLKRNVAQHSKELPQDGAPLSEWRRAQRGPRLAFATDAGAVQDLFAAAAAWSQLPSMPDFARPLLAVESALLASQPSVTTRTVAPDGPLDGKVSPPTADKASCTGDLSSPAMPAHDGDRVVVSMRTQYIVVEKPVVVWLRTSSADVGRHGPCAAGDVATDERLATGIQRRHSWGGHEGIHRPLLETAHCISSSGADDDSEEIDPPTIHQYNHIVQAAMKAGHDAHSAGERDLDALVADSLESVEHMFDSMDSLCIVEEERVVVIRLIVAPQTVL